MSTVSRIARKLDERLSVEFTPHVLRLCRTELADRGTTCEFFARCPEIATTPYRNRYSVVYLCDSHYQIVTNARGATRSDLDTKISVWMYGGLLRKSYVYQNTLSGGLLDQVVDAHEAEVKRAQEHAARKDARLVAEQRGLIAADALKAGAPDEDLLTGRDRNDLRKKLHQPQLGPQKKSPTVSTVSVPNTDLPDLPFQTPILS